VCPPLPKTKAINMKYLIIIALLPTLLLAQEFEFQLETDSIQVEIDGWTPFCPWAGGESESSPEFADIDADGDLDCFLGNFQGTISYFENNGDSNIPDYSFITWTYAGIDIGNYPYAGRSDPVFIDIDADGDLDAFTSGGRGLVHYWENQGTTQEPFFVWITDSLENIDVPGRAHLDFLDIDADNDYDLLIGDNTGKIQYFKNIGNSSLFDFELETSQMSNIDIGDKASPCFVDIDSDNDYDLFIGERYGTISYYRNDGDSANYNYTYVTDFFDSIDVGGYASPELADIDGDGDYDLFVGKEANSSALIGDVYFYENIGTPDNADFILRAKSYLMLDINRYKPKPQIVDINGDLAHDLMVGVSSNINFIQNIGDSVNANFLFIEEGFQNIYISSIKPCFVDIDNDGDYDLIAGEGAIPGPPDIALYLNEGTPRNPDFQLYNSQFITNVDFEVNANPGTADIDGDGDYDLFVSDDDGHFFYY